MKLPPYMLAPLVATMLLSGCGSKSTSAAATVELNVGGGAYIGTYTNAAATDFGDIRLDLTQDESDNVSGVVAFLDSVCLQSGSAFGQVIGSSLSLTVTQSQGEIVMNLNVTNTSIQGSYTAQNPGDDGCSNQTGTGTLEASR